MEELLDNLWLKIEVLIHYIRSFLDLIFTPLNIFGPAIAISSIAFITVVITKFLSKTFTTKRYKELQKEFEYWHNLRQEALKCEDPEKAKHLARNIDQAKLNKVYYDYFFEGLLISLVTKALPILIFLAYVNEAYKPETLLKLFEREYVFRFMGGDGEALLVGGVFWFVVSIVLIYVAWAVIGRILKKRISDWKKQKPGKSRD